MKKLLIGLLAVTALALLAGPASAAKLLRQNNDGTASWCDNVSGECVPTGEHTFTVTISDIATAATQYVTIPFAGRVKSYSVTVGGQILTATEVITFYIAEMASSGCVLQLGCGATTQQFTPITPVIAQAATGLYELQLGIAYAVTGQRSHVDIPYSSANTSPTFGANAVIAINNDGGSTIAGPNDWEDEAVVTIIVH